LKRLRFVHIPKTAGSTFTTILHRQYRKNNIFIFHGDLASDKKRFEALSERERENVALFSGHAPVVTGIDEADNATMITILRNPISRVKSFCQHVSEGKSPYLIHDFPPESFNLDEFLESGNEELSNFQTRMLVDDNNSASLLSFESMSASEAIDVALDRLFHKISYFGLQEYFDESLIVFSSALNWKMPVYAAKNRKNTRKLLHFEERHLKRIAELNTIDMELYNIAREHFVRMLESASFDKEKLKRLRSINNALGFYVTPVRERISQSARNSILSRSNLKRLDSNFSDKVMNNTLTAGSKLIEKTLWLFNTAQIPSTPIWAKVAIVSTSRSTGMAARPAASATSTI
jgi:hypothetical protein